MLWILFILPFYLTIIYFLVLKGIKPGVIKVIYLFHLIQILSFIPLAYLVEDKLLIITQNADKAILFAGIGLIVHGLGLRWVVSKISPYTKDQLKDSLLRIRYNNILLAYILSTLFLTSLRSFDAFDQILVTISGIKWVFFMVLGFYTLVLRERKTVFFFVFLFEFLSAFGGYFSDFKTAFVFCFMVLLSLSVRWKFKRLIFPFILSIFFFGLLLAWTAIKFDYRQFVNGGSRRQVVTVSKSEAISFMLARTEAITWKELQTSSSLMLYRVQYVYHLAKVMDRIPGKMNYERGKLWIDNLKFVYSPRIFFPNKGYFDASAKTNKYTGLNYTKSRGGASFSLGYFAENYIDFGFFAGCIPLFLIGCYAGLIYVVLFKSKLELIFKITLVNIALFPFMAFETDAIILLGRSTYNLIFYGFLMTFFSGTVNKMFFRQGTNTEIVRFSPGPRSV